MRLEQLIYILEIEKQKSISKAAEKLFISQPSLSIALNNFEKELGVPIFLRGKHGMQPTLIGQSVLAQAKKILQMVEELKNINNLSSPNLIGELRILIPFFSSYDISYRLITHFQKNYPKMKLNLSEHNVFESIKIM